MEHVNRKHWALAMFGLLIAGLVVSSDADATSRTYLNVGVTHVQGSIDGPDGPSMSRATSLLSSYPGTFQNIILMGWGDRNPNPAPGVYDWTDIDRRISHVRQTGGTPVVTLCCAPDWMKGGAPGTTDWGKLGYAPYMSKYWDFAQLAKQVAIRYPDVKFFQVWSEMRGFWDASANTWRSADYTKMYNLVYDALKSVNSSIQVGGPYVSMRSFAPGETAYPSSVSGQWGVIDQRDLDAVSYWLKNAKGKDFVTVDGSVLTAGSPRRLLVSAAASTEKFGAVSRWIRSQTTIPIWWAEYYPVPFGNPTGMSEAEQVSVTQRGFQVAEAAGVSVALMWQPEGHGSLSWLGMWGPTWKEYGGFPTSIYNVAKPWLGRHAVDN